MSTTDMNALPKVENVPPTPGSFDEKESLKEKDGFPTVDDFDVAVVGDVYEDVRAIDLGENGKERPIGTRYLIPQLFRSILTYSIAETDADWSLRLISLEDDPTQPVWTFRLWFLSIGLSCFGAVLRCVSTSLKMCYCIT